MVFEPPTIVRETTMRVLLLILSLLLIPESSAQNSASEDGKSPVVIITSKWFRDRQPIDNAVSVSVPPVAAVTSADKIYERQRRVNDPAGVRDPKADTLDARGAELDRIVQESRESQPVDGFAYQIKVQNASAKPIRNIFWEYRFREIAKPDNVARRQFLCSVQIKPEKQRDLQAFSLGGPSDVVNVKSLAKDSNKQFEEAVLINRVEFADGTFWQRKDWNFDDVKLTATARDTKNLPMCRGL
ncbi:MAG: hypothetical protein DMF74_22985 [Acidobacteria bacterium]|nr:MAG: hypothetical protein DMF74_22985 [Acidobacteriota bacterium]